MKQYQTSFKSRIIRQLVSFIGPDLDYAYYASIGSFDFCDSNLFSKYFTDVDGKDYVEGKIGSTSVVFSFVRSKRTIDIPFIPSKEFTGFFLKADFNKDFLGQIYVLPDIAENLLGFVGKELQELDIFRGQLVNLEDSEFEKLFKVYSNNQITARYILTTSLMKRITKLNSNVSEEIYISFIDSKMYLAIPYFYDLFEAKYLSSMLDFGTILGYFEYLELLIGIVDELNLNENSWRKDLRNVEVQNENNRRI